jgi:tRNA pseudouridine55 synthase
VCHTGTLDTFAHGLLVVLSGQAVKLSAWFTGCDKRYIAEARFGEETDTLDPQGKVIASAPVPKQSEIEAALPSFTGEIMQAPPLYSAIHINGKRAHELARAGIETEMKQRPVTIYELSLMSWNPPLAELEVHCSSGTYIRSLARDIALSLGSRAHLRSLRRAMVGGFSIEEALSLHPETREAEWAAAIRAALKPLSPELFARIGVPCITVDEKTARDLSHGVDLNGMGLSLPEFPTETDHFTKWSGEGSPLVQRAALFGPSACAAVIEQKNGSWKYCHVFTAH